MARIEEIIDGLYENDKDFKEAYDLLQRKLNNTSLGFGLDTIIDKADKHENKSKNQASSN